MTFFLGTSALAKIYHVERGSVALRELYDGEDVLVISDLSRLEFVSASARRFRDGLIGKSAFDDLLARFAADVNSRYHVIRISQAIIDESIIVLANQGMDYSLRSLDAIQYGTFRAIGTEDARFVSADKRLIELARVSGYVVLNPIEF